MTLMARETEELDLSEVQDALEAWRQVARVTSAHGAETYRSRTRRSATSHSVPPACSPT